MKFFKLFSLYSYILFCICTVNAQEDVKSPSLMAVLPKYEIVNPVINDLLDSLDLLAENCNFCLLGKPYYFLLDFRKMDDTTIVITANVEQYGSILILKDQLGSSKNKGYFYRNDILTIAYSNNDLGDFLICKNDSLHELYYHYSYPIIPTYLKSVEKASVQYRYYEEKLNKEWESRCHDTAYFFKRIEESDTWEYLLDQCKCSEEVVHYLDGEYVEELPKTGDYLIIEYRVDEDKKITMNRISLKTVLADETKKKARKKRSK